MLPGSIRRDGALRRKAVAQDRNPVLSNLEFMRPLDLSRAETIEVITRISPSTNALEILSRPRLSRAGWTTHARCTISRGHGAMPSAPQLSSLKATLARDQVYQVATDSGLNYGPTFQLVEHLRIYGNDVIEVQLPAAPMEGQFALDPVRLDCCLHAMFGCFRNCTKEARRAISTHRPISLYQPNAMPVRAVVEIVKNSHDLANYYI